MSFEKLEVFKPLLNAVNDLGYKEPAYIIKVGSASCFFVGCFCFLPR